MNTRAPQTPRTLNAVMVVPGIMGSELVDTNGDVAWGLKPSLLAKAWATRRLSALIPTDEELDGTPRLRPTRLLRDAGWLPILGGLEPYTTFLKHARQTTRDERAVEEFPYDWRLPFTHNGPLLVSAAESHLRRWQDIVRSEKLGNPDDVKLVIVAHSMGGLITRYATHVLGLEEILGGVITAGTPYFGSLKAVLMLATGESDIRVPKRAARELALRCPGLYDLLPRYRCVTGSEGLRQFTPDDVSAICADQHDVALCHDLAIDAVGRWSKLQLTQSHASPVPLTAILGNGQPTSQSVTFNAGACEFHPSLDKVDYAGDSTVYRDSATPIGVQPIAIPQKHGALLKTHEALTVVADRLLDRTSGPPLGTRPIGADIPDMVRAGQAPIVTVADNSPVGISVRSTALDTNRPTTWRGGRTDGKQVRFTGPILRPGLHRVEVKAGGFSAVTDILMVSED